MELVIVERNGWTKPVKIERSITRVGSAASNDVQLESERIAPLQLQFIYSPEVSSVCKLVNLSGVLKLKLAGKPAQLQALAAVEVGDGDEIELGEFRLLVKLPLGSGLVRSSGVIEASLFFAEAILRPDIPSIGRLTIKNSGAREASQFQVILKGLPDDCYQVDPVPLMYPGAQEEVRLRLFHRTSYPQAGYHALVVAVSAPESYPGEELLLEQKIFVAPVFNQVLEINDDLKREAQHPKAQPVAATRENVPDIPPPAARMPASEPRPAPLAQPEAEPPARQEPASERQPEPVLAAPAPVAQVEAEPPPASPVSQKTGPAGKNEPAPAQSVVAVAPRPKVVHGPADEFWDQ